MVTVKSAKMPALEGVRGLAILLVFCAHYDTLFGVYATSAPVAQQVARFLGTVGHSGVDLFFVLSGFLIYGSLLQRPCSFTTFMWRRLRRIYPTFAVVLAAYIGLSFMIPTESKIPRGGLAAARYLIENALLLPGILPTPPMITVSWSLSYEMAFYVCIGLLVSVCSLRMRTRRVRITLLLALTVPCALLFLKQAGPLVRISMFLIGMLTYEVIADQRVVHLMSRRTELIVLGLSVVALPLLYLSEALWEGTWTLRGAILLSLTWSAIIMYVFAFDGILRRVFSSRALGKLGTISYSFYLIHGLTLKTLSLGLAALRPTHTVAVFAGMFPVGLATAIVVSAALFYAVEEPFSVASGARGSSVTVGMQWLMGVTSSGSRPDAAAPSARC